MNNTREVGCRFGEIVRKDATEMEIFQENVGFRYLRDTVTYMAVSYGIALIASQHSAYVFILINYDLSSSEDFG